MQKIKDSFFIALRDRLAVLNPLRTISVQGVSRPAILVVENELVAAGPQEPEVFYMHWGITTSAAGTERLEDPLMKVNCEISYWTEGSDDLSSQDRGRTLAALDRELMLMSEPKRAALKDFAVSPALDSGSSVFWTRPTLGETTKDGRKLMRSAKLDVFSFAEVSL
ncbi:MAG: hypothetical protein JWO13_1350 [Acidobacteriales bacterium]|nr:hypothetical protein [Terriglobales bacterium]